MSEPRYAWHTEQWFTSSWNFDPSVRDQLHFPSNVQIHDATLRDGEQQAGVVFTADDKIAIGEALSAAGIHRIEAGLPAVSPDDEKAIKSLVKRNLDAEIYAFSRCMLDDVKRAVDCGVKGIVLEIPSSRHLIELGYKWTVERAIASSVEATRYAHEQGLKVTFFPIDATRAAEAEGVARSRPVRHDRDLDALVLVDTFGTLTPQAVGRFVQATRDRFDVPLETHFHQDYGMGVANSVIAAAAGVATLHVTVGGIGERAGNAPLEETVLALRTLYNVDTGILLDQLTSLHRMVMARAGVNQPSNRPVTGSRLFNVESGIISTWVRNVRGVDLTESFPYLPALVGQDEVQLVLGKGSGVDSIVDALERVGLTATPEQVAALLTEVKAASLAEKRLLELDEFERMARALLSGAMSGSASAGGRP